MPLTAHRLSFIAALLLFAATPSHAQYTGIYGGLQPLKLGPSVIGVNPGTCASADGSELISTTAVLTADLSTGSINTMTNPPTGGMINGPLSITDSSTDGADVQLYIVTRNSDGAPAIVGDVSNVYGGGTNANVTSGSAMWTTGGAPSGFWNGTRVNLTGSSIPAPFAAGVDYYAVAEPNGQLSTLVGLAGSPGGAPIPATSTGFAVIHYGVQDHLDRLFGPNVWTVKRRVHFAFRWKMPWCPGCGGIPDFTADPRGDMVWLTDPGNGAWQALSNGSASSLTAVDLSPWLSNLNRIAVLRTYVSGTGSGGTAYVRPSMGVSSDIPVGEAPVSGITRDYGNVFVQTDSQGKILYKILGGGELTFSVVGWLFVDPS